MEFAYNNAPHLVTGMTPFQAAYGHTPLVPTNFVLQHKVALADQLVQEMQDILVQVRDKLVHVQRMYQKQANKHRRHAKFNEGMNFCSYRFDEVAFSFNGGKDSTVLLHLLRAGYAAAEGMQEFNNGAEAESQKQHPIRAIYFESPDAFPEIDAFTLETATLYKLEMEIIRLDFKSGVEALLKEKPIKAIFLGTRIGDPNAVGQEQFSPSSTGWPPFMRVNPILDWSYRDVWAFLLTCKAPYCKLYDQGYTSIGSIHDTVPNGALCIESCQLTSKEPAEPASINYRPAYMLRDGRLERAGRLKRPSKMEKKRSVTTNGDVGVVPCANSLFAASVLVVGDEILRGEVEDHLGVFLNKKLHSIGWAVTRRVIVANDIDAISEEVEQRAEVNDLVFVVGGVGSLHSDVSLAGVAKAFGVRLAPDEEFEEFLRQQVGELCPGDQNEMAKLPEGITELWHHKDLAVPVIKCKNVFILSGTTVGELDLQWQCLVELSKDTEMFEGKQQFTSVRLGTTIPELELAGPFSRIDTDFPDLSIGCYRESRQVKKRTTNPDGQNYLVLTIVGKNADRVNKAVAALLLEFSEGTFKKIE
ncbi:hypothetical protein L7F22_002628 [Adiantum nelumboides]|nr:hypothetical protein [Adiantum nelumboides]